MTRKELLTVISSYSHSNIGQPLLKFSSSKFQKKKMQYDLSVGHRAGKARWSLSEFLYTHMFWIFQIRLFE